jgi:mRNA-degrading endonuclease YafQ of YafQ-DinJ toxin-antitoxin module
VQTFLPYPDFVKSVQVLDYRRLGKQRVETYQVLNVLLERTHTKGWRNHPVTRMWSGYEEALKVYQNHTIAEWMNRGYKNTMAFEEVNTSQIVLPSWFGDDQFHRSHRSNLLRKDYQYYSEYFDEPSDLEYHWPV